jgi:hypothetical protein
MTSNAIALVERFFAEARNVSSGTSTEIGVGASDVVLIARDAAGRAAFRDEFKRLNDGTIQDLIKDYLSDFVSDLENGCERTEIGVDLIDRAAMVPSAGTLVAGIAALAAAAPAAPFLLAGGLVAVVVSGVGRTYMRTIAQRSRASARKVKQLRESL